MSGRCLAYRVRISACAELVSLLRQHLTANVPRGALIEMKFVIGSSAPDGVCVVDTARNRDCCCRGTVYISAKPAENVVHKTPVAVTVAWLSSPRTLTGDMGTVCVKKF
jgi:hypothetical protein